MQVPHQDLRGLQPGVSAPHNVNGSMSTSQHLQRQQQQQQQPRSGIVANGVPHQQQQPSAVAAVTAPALLNNQSVGQNGSIVWPQSFTNLPASTQEFLKRAGTPTSLNASGPEWAAARKQVIESMIAGNDSPSLLMQKPPSARGRPDGRARGGRSRGGGQSRPSSNFSNDLMPAASVLASQPVKTETDFIIIASTPPMTRGRGRGGRARGKRVGRKGRTKRKRDDDTEESSSHSDNEGSDADAEGDNTPLPTITKSGRSVQKPSQFKPVSVESPSSGVKRRRSYHRNKDPEKIICAKCSRGHSPPSNAIVLCDGCEMAYHQWCHDPFIPIEVTQFLDKTWFCGQCLHRQAIKQTPLEDRVPGSTLTEEQKHSYLSSLSAETLLALLMHATHLEPGIPIFPPELISKNPTQNGGAMNKSSLAKTSSPYTTLASSSSNHTTSTAPVRQTSTTSQTTSVRALPLEKTLDPIATTSASSLFPDVMRNQTGIHASPCLTPTTSISSKQSTDRSESAMTTQTALSSTAESLSEKEKPDPYPDHTNSSGDPPFTYPRPGRGPYQLKPTTSPEDLPWLLDDNFEVFSHLVADTAKAKSDARVASSGERRVGMIRFERDRAGAWVGSGIT